jgi:hypothetical protein
MIDPNRLIDAYLDGTLSQEQLDQLEHDLATNPKYADAFAAAMMISELLGQRFEQESITKTMQLGDGSFIGEADLQHLQDDYDHAEADLVTILKLDAEPVKTPSFTESAWAIAYGVKCLVRSKPTPFITSAIAALLLIAIWLISPFASNGPAAPGTEFASPPTEISKPVLATLTAQHNATWTEGALAPGSPLHAGDRLTLTAGFAEITTNRGAVAILEAPATIELLNNDNALHLHAGKLVGICETESAKGFVVRTPHMDITDLGTRFGVDANSITTEVHVLQGEIEAATVSSGSGEEDSVARLVEGEALSCEAGKIQRITLDANRFATSAHTHILPGTGLHLNDNEIDRAWQIAAIDGELLDEPIGLNVFIDADRKKLANNEPALAQWINYSPPNWEEGANDNRVYTLQTTIVIPSNIDLDDSSLVMDYVADDYVAGLVINGRPADISNLTSQKKRKGRIILSASEYGLVSGVNTVEFQIFNRIKHIGLHMSWRVQGDAGRLSTIYP